MKPTSLGVAVALAKEPDKETSVELFISTLPVVTVTPGSTPVGSSPPTPPPDGGQLALTPSNPQTIPLFNDNTTLDEVLVTLIVYL